MGNGAQSKDRAAGIRKLFLRENARIDIIVSGHWLLRLLPSMSKFLSILGDKVRGRRAMLSLSQQSLALKAGVHPNVVGRLERGGYNPTVLTLRAFAKALHMPLRDLL